LVKEASFDTLLLSERLSPSQNKKLTKFMEMSRKIGAR
jgi:50S ribosomal subunit-associated GTPase HflX